MSDEKLKDQAMVGSEIAPGVRHVVRRRGDGDLQLGHFHEVKEGQPIPPGAEVVLVGKPGDDGWRDVESIYGGRSGPPQVATPEYREGYDRIFGNRKVGLA